MVFSAPVFLFLFLPLALGAYFVAPRALRLAVLTGLSLLFYAWSGPWFVLLLVWTICVDYVAGALLAGDLAGPLSPRTRRMVLVGSLTNSIGLLCFFKYAAPVAAGVGLGELLTRIALPAGVSFYTFESISYVVDLYRGIGRSAGAPYLQTEKRSAWQTVSAHAKGLIAFACYISQFPHLVAGPIIRFHELQSQLIHRRPGAQRFARGVMRFAVGLAKKVLIADTLGAVVDIIFAHETLHMGYLWTAAIAFWLQIYFDFSGYTDMAIGLALMLGFRFPENFASPYHATSVTDFWRRWHMTLSRWLRDYVYIPLGGNRLGGGRTCVNLMLTMTLAGIWHGAGLSFLIWGVLHGVMLVVERVSGITRDLTPRRRAAGRAYTTLFLILSWVMFRSVYAEDGVRRITSMLLPIDTAFDPAIWNAINHWTIPAAAMAGVMVVVFGVRSDRFCRNITPAKAVFAGVLFVAAIWVVLLRTSVPFLYFRF